ncbi:MAG TPA: glycosyltransferase family 87 protein [Candidatus Limnocylindrales bacterium]|nr:glycosyltransferase family 87 protein [Candidatus Limnocylindrales bacterium]
MGIREVLARTAPYLLGAAGLVMTLLAAQSFPDASGFAYDFDAYDTAARRVATGQPLYPPGTAEAYNSGQYAGLYLYAPPLAVAVVPLTALGPDAAALAWLWLRVAVLVAAIAILPIPRLARGAVLAVAGLTFPVWYDLNIGNLSVALFAISAVVWRYRDAPAGPIALAVAGTVRYPFVIVVVAWALARRFRAVAWTIGAGVVLGLLTLPVVGISTWFDYLATLRALGDITTGEHNLTLATTAAALGLPGPQGAWVIAGVAIAGAAAAFAALRRDAETATVVALTATILFSPFFHPHYLAQLLVPAAFLAGRGQWWGLALPLLGWLPGEAMAVVAIVGIVAPLLPPGLGAIRPAGRPAAGALDGGTGSAAGPTRP